MRTLVDLISRCFIPATLLRFLRMHFNRSLRSVDQDLSTPTRNRLSSWAKAALEEASMPGSTIERCPEEGRHFVARDGKEVYALHPRTFMLFSRAGWITTSRRIPNVFLVTERGRKVLRESAHLKSLRRPGVGLIQRRSDAGDCCPRVPGVTPVVTRSIRFPSVLMSKVRVLAAEAEMSVQAFVIEAMQDKRGACNEQR